MTAAQYRWACFSCSCLLALLASVRCVGAPPAPGAASAVPEFVAVQLAAVEADREVLHNLREVVSAVQKSLKIADPKERYSALVENASALHPLVPADAPPVPAEIRSALEAALQALKPDADPAVFKVLDEEEKWLRIAATVNAEVRRTGQELDALRLIRQALSGEPKRVEHLLQAEHLLDALASEGETPRIARLAKYTRETMASLPPPALFTTTLGIDLVLLALDPPVYVSKEPVTWKAFAAFLNEANPAPRQFPWPAEVVRVDPATGKYTAANPDAPVTGVPHDLATAFCGWASAKTQMAIELPAAEQLRGSRQPETIALWTRTPWQPPDEIARDMQARFGVAVFTIWDPLKKIGADQVTGELPYATYPALGFRVAAAVDAVKKARLQRLHAEMNLPQENGAAGQAKTAGNLP